MQNCNVAIYQLGLPLKLKVKNIKNNFYFDLNT